MEENTTWNYTQIADFYNRVRSLLNNTSISTLTDIQIDMPEKAPVAEFYIKELVPLWTEYEKWEQYKDTDPTKSAEYQKKFSLFQSCIVYQTAIYFEQYVKAKQPKRMQSSSINIEYSTSGNIKDEPEIKLNQVLGKLLEQLQEKSGTRFFGFLVTDGVIN